MTFTFINEYEDPSKRKFSNNKDILMIYFINENSVDKFPMYKIAMDEMTAYEKKAEHESRKVNWIVGGNPKILMYPNYYDKDTPEVIFVKYNDKILNEYTFTCSDADKLAGYLREVIVANKCPKNIYFSMIGKITFNDELKKAHDEYERIVKYIVAAISNLIKTKHVKDINFAVTKSYENTSAFWREIRPIFIMRFAELNAFEGFDLRCN